MPFTPVEYCPFCRRVLVDLAEYHAQDNIEGIDFRTDYTDRWSSSGTLLDILLMPFALLGAVWKQRRLDRVLTQYPYSLYCGGCGHVERRRFPPADD